VIFQHGLAYLDLALAASRAPSTGPSVNHCMDLASWSRLSIGSYKRVDHSASCVIACTC